EVWVIRSGNPEGERSRLGDDSTGSGPDGPVLIVLEDNRLNLVLRESHDAAIGEFHEEPVTAMLIRFGTPVADDLSDLARLSARLLVARCGDANPVHGSPIPSWEACRVKRGLVSVPEVPLPCAPSVHRRQR